MLRQIHNILSCLPALDVCVHEHLEEIHEDSLSKLGVFNTAFGDNLKEANAPGIDIVFLERTRCGWSKI